jgi:neutral amino acid transport system ATP-binding protein
VIEPEDGTVIFDGTDITGLMPHVSSKLGLGRTFQITRELSAMTVLENMVVSTVYNGFRSLIGGRMSSAERETAMDLLEFVGIEHMAEELAKSLSFGQRKLLEFAAVLMAEPKLVLLDEPAGGVNPALLDRLLDRIEEINRAGTSFLIVEHNMDVVMRLSHSVVVMALGKVILQDTPERVREDGRVLDAYLGKV